MKTASWILTDVAALAIGGIVGAGVALLMAPQSGRATRALLYSQGVALKEKATEEALMGRSRMKRQINGLASQARIQATEISDRVQAVVDHPQAALEKAFSSTPPHTNHGQ